MLEFFLDMLFPQACVMCGDVGGYICPRCYALMRFYDKPVDIDISSPSLDSLLACTTYTGIGSELIGTYKYSSAFALAPTISQLMRWHIPKPEHIDYVMPVPLHKKRENDRGFNQAELLAKRLSKSWNIPMIKPLVRVKATTPQAELTRIERLNHLVGAFDFDPKFEQPKDDEMSKLAGKSIALIDDVATTSTTLNECAKILKKQNVKEVIGVVFAHGG